MLRPVIESLFNPGNSHIVDVRGAASSLEGWLESTCHTTRNRELGFDLVYVGIFERMLRMRECCHRLPRALGSIL